MAEKKCPLCNQPVSEQLFEKITGIWKEREKQEKALNEKKKLLLKQQKENQRKFEEQKKRLIKDQKEKVEEQVKEKAKKYEIALKNFGKEKKKIKERADKRILAAVKDVERKERAKYQSQMKEQLKKSLDIGVKKSTAKLLAEKKKMNNTLESTRKQMATLQSNSSKQQAKIDSLERQLKNKTTPQLEGLLYEDTLTAALQKEFPGDKLKNTGKGGDILHDVVFDKEVVGIIVYECKKVSHWSGSHLDQTVEAKISRKADFAVLVTNVNKKGTSGFFIEKGVVVVNPGGVLAIATILREQLMKIAQLKLSKVQKNEAIEATLKYLESPEYKNSLDTVIRKTVEMYDDLQKEYQDHLKAWRKRHDSLKVVYLNASQVKERTFALLAGRKSEELEIKPFPALPELKEK